MSAPVTILRRNLTFHFAAAVSVVDGQQVVQTMEVAVTPLTSPSAPAANLTYAGGVQEQTVLLNQTDNTAVFQLIPTNAPGLTAPLTYRAAWRLGGPTGAVNEQDFSMPDQDCDWDDLASLGSLISGEAYLQQSDLGVPGRVAMLNAQGQVVDADGNPVTMPADLTAVTGQVQAETVARQQAVSQLSSTLNTTITTQGALTQAQAKSYTDQQIEIVDAAIGSEAGARQNAIASTNAAVSSLNSTLSGQISTLNTEVAGLTATVAAKADLDNGLVPINQIPPSAITSWVQVADTTAMTQLTSNQVQVGDVALTPTAAYVLLASDPSQLSNWRLINDVTSVNGYTGVINLTAADVGAVAATNGSILMTQVTGLSTALSLLASASSVSALQTQVTNLANDATVVHTTSGVIQDAVLPANIALISPQNNITNKSGQVIAIGEGSGVASVNGQTGVVVLTPALIGALASNGTISESQVNNLTQDLANRVLATDSRLTNARTPTAHANSHQLNGSDQLALDPSQVTGLNTTLTNQGNNISALDTRVTSLEATGPGGYGAGTGLFFAAAAATGDFSTVTLHSPFGYNPTNPNANAQGYYMDPAGALASDVVYPVVNVAGALAFRKIGQANTPDPYYAAASAVTTLSQQVALKANQSDLTSLQTTVGTLATAASVTSLANTVASKANQTDLQSLSVTVSSKANSSDLAITNSTVATKAAQSDMTNALASITILNGAMATKADLVGGVLKASEIPTGIPINNIAGLQAYLANLNSSTGQFDASQLTNIANIPGVAIGSVTGLTNALAAKADLINNRLNPAQLPSLALTDVFSVTAQSAMLQLSTAHQGDVCVITQGPNIGTYILSASDYTQLANWVPLQFPSGQVSSVNGYTGTVVLAAADVGALASNAQLPISQVSGLQTQLNSFATTTALNTATSGLTSPSQVQALMAASTAGKQAANYVATSPISTLSGRQSVDGVLVPLGATVLATAQSSSINNGLWIVNSGAWTRTTDFATGSYFLRGSLVVVTQGTNNANTLWQETAASGVVDTAGSSWLNIGSVAPPLAYTNGNGMNLVGTQFSVKPATGGGIAVSSSGVALDNTVVRKATGTIVPNGSQTIFTLTHNLNVSTPVRVVLEDTTTGNIVEIGATVQSPNAVSIEFGNAPASGQYAWAVFG